MKSSAQPYRPVPHHALTEREGEILRLVISDFIDTAGPVGSRALARRYPLGISPASIRNTMSDLEERGFLDHPYTSAGRVPTELGYRVFVDQLMMRQSLSREEGRMLREEMERASTHNEVFLKECSRLLGRLSNLLGVVLSPKLSKGILERMEAVPLSSSRLMFVISLRGGLFKTIVLEVESELDRRDVDAAVAVMNERLAGLTLEDIRRTYASRMQDVKDEKTGIVRLVFNATGTVFSEPADGRMSFAGAQHILAQPEFQEDPEALRNLISLLEEEDVVVQLFEDETGRPADPGKATVRIGSEIVDGKVDKYSIVTASYQLGETSGTIGIIGPTRMDYVRVVALVEGMASLLGRHDRATHH
ncbi:MAG: heat-inducible transcriptional repressor HrcA [Rhodothermales bacterium]